MNVFTPNLINALINIAQLQYYFFMLVNFIFNMENIILTT